VSYRILFIALIVAALVGQAYGQPFPIPPPFPSVSENTERIAEGDKTPPKIEILTEELNAGKNVLRVRITDDSTLRVRDVRYVQDGQFKSEGLFRDQDDVYKGLIDIQPPSRIVVVTAGDSAGNIASTFREYEVSSQRDIFKDIMDVLGSIPGYIRDFLDKF
jgi:hypothetical protein